MIITSTNTRDQNILSKRCNFCSSNVRHKIQCAKFLEETSLTTLLNFSTFITISNLGLTSLDKVKKI